MKNLFLLGLAAVFAVACVDGETDDSTPIDDSEEPSEYTGPWQIAQVDWELDCTAETHWVDVVTDGWAAELTLDLVNTGDTTSATPFSEFHVFTNNVEWAEDGSWDHWDITLDFVTTPGDVVSGSTTLHNCTVLGTNPTTQLQSAAWKVSMYDANDSLDDCAIWGEKSETEFAGDGCLCFDATNGCGDL